MTQPQPLSPDERLPAAILDAFANDARTASSDVAVMSDDLMKLPEAIRLSKATLQNIYQNVFIAIATVTLLLLGVLFGQVHMAGGMLIHEASVLIVILNGMRLLRKKPGHPSLNYASTWSRQDTVEI